MKILAVVACIVLAVMMFAPIATPVNARIPAVMNTIQYRFFSTASAVFSALLTPDSQGGIDSMQWLLTHSQYDTIANNTGIIVEPVQESGDFELAFNSNLTDGLQMDRRSPMNYTDFRNAMNCLVDKNGVIAGPTLGGFATRVDTQVPTPVQSAYVNPAVSFPNYPWEFNVTHALEILYNGGWYSHTIYPTFGGLLTAYGGGTGPLSSAGGTDHGVVYSGNDPSGQWGGGDPKAQANAAIANQPIAALKGYIRSNDARKDIGDFFVAELKAIGCPYSEIYEPTLTALRPFVLKAQLYDFATLGYSFGAPPNWWYSQDTPAGIYTNGPNPYLIQDANMTKYATATFLDSDPAQFKADVMTVQYILVMESYIVSVYSPQTFAAYKTGLLGQIDIIGQGTEMNGGQSENWIALESKKTNTINYTGPPSGTPESNILYWGLYNPPDQVNPIMQDEVYDFQVTDEIFTYPIGGNPYTFVVGSALTGVPTGNDLPWMAYAWKTELVPNPTGTDVSGNGNVYPTWTNVTLWLRNDIKWQDGVQFTSDDINYTIYINAVYGDSWDGTNMVWACNITAPAPGQQPSFAPYFQKDITPSDPTGSYTCSILVSSPSWLNLYLPLYQTVPYHLYKYIVPSNLTDAENGVSTDGIHGLWPGQAAVAGNILPGAPFTLSDLQNKPETTLVGTGPYVYRVGSTDATSIQSSGGGITLDAYPGFFMPVTPGAIALKYTWVNTSPSQQPSGGYFKIGLADLVELANAYGTTGTPPSTVSLSSTPGNAHTWNPAANLAAPSGTVGLSSLVTLALHYGWYFGNYSYNAPYPPAEIANGGP